MTIGTAIVVSVGIVCATFIVMLCIGASVANKKQTIGNQLAKEILERKNKI